MQILLFLYSLSVPLTPFYSESVDGFLRSGRGNNLFIENAIDGEYFITPSRLIHVSSGSNTGEIWNCGKSRLFRLRGLAGTGE